MYKLFFGQLSDQQTELLTHIHTRVQGMVLCAVVWSWYPSRFDRYDDYSTKIATRSAKKKTATRVHQLDLKYHCQLEMQF